MLYLQAKYLESRELPAEGGFKASTLVAVLDGTDTLHLVGADELADQLADLEPFADVLLELRHRKIDLASFGGSGKGKAYKLRIVRVLDGDGAGS
jgi:hypothetical protein